MIEKKKLPKDWQIKTLGEVCEIKSGKNQKNVVNPNGKYPIYGSSGIFGYADEYICDENTTIIGRKGTINSPIYVTSKFWNVDTAFGLCAKEDLNSKFLYYFCLGFNFKKLDKSTTIPSLSKSDLLSIQLNIPSLQTQQAIVSKIEELFSELDKGIEDLKTAQQQLKTYRQSVLKWAFEGKLTNENVKEGELPKGWEIKTLGEVCFTTSGGTPSRRNLNYYNGVIPWVKSGELNKGIIYNTEEKITEEAIKNSSAKIFPKGTLLIALYGATIGKLAFLGVDAATNQAICGIYENKNISSYYLYYFLAFNKSKLVEQGIGGAQPNISQTILKNLLIPIAQLEEQHRIVQEIESRLSVADKMEESIAQSLQQAEALRQSILKKAFSGELV